MIFPTKMHCRFVKPVAILLNSLSRRRLASAAVARREFAETPIRDQTEAADKKRWQLIVAVCLERFPLISPEPTELEIKYYDMIRTIEDERSLRSHHELRHQEDRRVAKKGASGKTVIQTEERQIITAQDFEDASVEERKRFTPAPRKSEADDANDKSLNRLADRKLVFLVKGAFGVKNPWDLPITILREGETLAQAAQRCVEESLDISPSAIFYGNAPRKLYKYKYPKPVMENSGAYGAKLFLFKSELPARSKITPRIDQYRWLCREELTTTLKGKRYMNSISSLIFE